MTALQNDEETSNHVQEEEPEIVTTNNVIATTAAENDPQQDRTVSVQGLPLDWTRLGVNTTDENGEGMAQKQPIVLRYPCDVVDSIDMDETELCIVGTAGQKITAIGNDFSRTVNTEMTSLILRSHIIRKMEGLQYFTKLQLLELYDNQIDALSNLNDGVNGCPGITLRTLDMSYNSIRDMQPIEFCPNLQEICTFSFALLWLVVMLSLSCCITCNSHSAYFLVYDCINDKK